MGGVMDKLALMNGKLDKQIRGLEMRESPLSDQEMERLKQNRLHLKDLIYQRLTQGS